MNVRKHFHKGGLASVLGPVRRLLIRVALLAAIGLFAGALKEAFAQSTSVDVGREAIDLQGVTVKSEFIFANGIRQHVVSGGSGETVILIHGWPMTWRSYSKLIPLLVNKGFRTVAIDLRGLGDTEVKGPYGYSVSAEDISGVMKELKIARAHVEAHDLSVPIAYILAVHHPELVKTLTVLDVPIQGFGLDAFAQKLHLWHFDFLQWPGAAEKLIPGKEREFYSLFYRTGRRGAISDENREIYLRAYSRPEALAATIAWFRDSWAGGRRELTAASEKRLEMPVLAVGGEYAGGLAPLESMRQLANNVHGGFIAGIGHHIPEEAPEELTGLLLAHFQSSSDRP